MSDHLARHRAQMEQLAYLAVEAFIARHPEYRINSDQSGTQSVTNFVILGHRNVRGGDEQVVFKYFCEDERKAREIYALRHFAATELVPRLLVDDGARLIVQSFIPGSWLPRPDEPENVQVDMQRAAYTLGQATATLVKAPLSPKAAREFERAYYDRLPLKRYLGDIVAAGRQLCRNSPAYHAQEFAASLAQIDAALPYILQQPRILYHQDAMNMHFLGSEFSGFFDLEMCRVGTVAMQIGSLWYLLAIHQLWPAFAAGFAHRSGYVLTASDFGAARAFAHFLTWRYATKSGRWHGVEEDGSDASQRAQDAIGYLESIRLHNSVTFAR